MTISQLRTNLEASREALFGLVRGLTEEQFRYRPASAEWTIATHLAHLLRIERLFTERAALALRKDGASVTSTGVTNEDEPALAQHLAVPQIIHGMLAARRALEATLDDGGEGALERAIQHERFGRMTVLQIAEKMATHEREHAESVRRLAEAAKASAGVIIPLAGRS
jgi:hypothetical protein